MNTHQKIYILIHGAWHASWCWKYITPQLQSAGHLVFTPDLPGHGQNQKPILNITMQDYLKSICDLIAMQSKPVILVGHSMAGVIISQIAEFIPEKIEKLIYVAAYIPKANESLLDLAAQSNSLGISAFMDIHTENNAIFLKQSPRLKQLFYNHCTDTDAAFALAQLQPQPFQPFTVKVSQTQEKFGGVFKLAIECTHDKILLREDQRRMYQAVTENIITLQTDHSPFFSTPQKLAEILVKVTPA